MSSRRDFLKKGVLSAVPFFFPNIITASSHKPKVAVLGGGLAGLTAAYYLRKKGIIASVFEAQSRIGGRVMTAKNLLADGITTELGGEFIDSNHYDILKLCKTFNLPLLDMQAPSEKKLVAQDFFFGNNRVSENRIVEELKNFSDTFLDDLKKVQNDDLNRIKELDKLSLTEYLQQTGMKGWLYELFKTSFTSELGLDAHTQGCIIMLKMVNVDLEKGKLEIYGDSDERYKISGGNEKLIDELGKQLTNQIYINYVLSEINQVGSNYTLNFDNGKQIKADVIINTLPFSALRNVKMNIDMSAMKRKCIDELTYGTQSKLFLGFKSRFWRENGFSGYLLNEDLHNGWDSSQMQKHNVGAGGYSLFIGGNKGKNLNSSDYETYLKELERVYPGAQINFNGRFACYNWTQNPFIGGAYSCYKTGQATTIAGLEGEPIGNIYFAGEHCSEQFGGFMNGAVESSRKAIAHVLKKIPN